MFEFKIVRSGLVAVVALLGPVMVAAQTELTCPSVANVHQLKGIWPRGPWLPLEQSNGELASDALVREFSETVTQLKKVEWNANYPEAGHCLYAGNSRIVLARDMLKPDALTYPHWHYTVEKKVAQCLSSQENDCPFGGVG